MVWRLIGGGPSLIASLLFFANTAAAQSAAKTTLLEDEYVPPQQETAQPSGEVPEFERAPRHRSRRDHFDTTPFHLELRVGSATTVGGLGVVAEYNPLDRLALGFGAGVNAYGSVFGANARVRPIVAASRGHALHALTLEGGVSYGLYAGEFGGGLYPGDTCRLCGTIRRQVEHIWWAQAELGWEARFASHLTLRTALGFAAAVNRPDWICTSDDTVVQCSSKSWDDVLFVQTIALGYAF